MLQQLTRDWLSLHRKYTSAAGRSREDLIPQLVKLARDRAVDRDSFLQIDAAVVLATAVPDEAYRTAPPAAQAYLESFQTVEGTIEADSSHPANAATGEAGLRLRDRQGRTWTLHSVGGLPSTAAGSAVKISGLAVGNALVFRVDELQTQSRSRLDTEAPSISFTGMHQGSVVKGTVAIAVQATDNSGISQVQLVRDGNVIETDRDSPFELKWSTVSDADGPHTVIVRAQDRDFNVGQASPITVTVDNTPPRVRVLSLSSLQSISGAVNVEMEASDTIGLDSVKLLVDGLSVGVVLKPPYAVLWDSAKGPNGAHAVQGSAVDRAGNATDSPAVEVRVLNANAAPVLDPIGIKTVQESLALSFRVTAHDPDGSRDTLTFRAENVPAWAGFDAATQEFRGTPDFTIASGQQPERVYPGVRIEVCDSQPLCDHETFDIIVQDVDRPPNMEPLGNAEIKEGEKLELRPTFQDADMGALPCTVKNAPTWAQIEPSTCTLRGTPGFDVATPRKPMVKYPNITFQACDPSGQCASTHMTVSVRNLNRQPKLAFIGDKRIDEKRRLAFDVQASDPDEQPLTLTTSLLPDGMTLSEAAPNHWQLAWEPAEDTAGRHEILFTVSDGNDEESERITIDVAEKVLTLSGKVIDDVKKPLVGLLVHLSRADGRIYETHTAKDGTYRVVNILPGTYTVRVRFNPSPGQPTKEKMGFSPLSHRTEVGKKDVTGVNFVGQPNP